MAQDCKELGHLYGAEAVCIMCGEPKPPTNEHARSAESDRRTELLDALSRLPDEAFGWFVMWALGQNMQFPGGLGGFSPESREAIAKLRAAAQAYLEGGRG